MTKVAPLWALLIFITQTGSVRSDMVFLQRNEGDSVLLPCAVEPRGPPPFGVYLKRHWLRPREVLFKHVGHEHTVDNGEDKGRIKVSGDANLHALNVTISQLSAADTGRYVCEFIVATVSSEDERRPGSSEFFLLVTAGGQCGCSNYSTLLYALSSAVVILVLLLALLFLVFYKGKARSSSTLKSHPQAPIYEEMTGLQAFGRKPQPRHLEEQASSEYTNCQQKKSCPENHYESPSGALGPRSDAQK